jgi:hypothetical protein
MNFLCGRTAQLYIRLHPLMLTFIDDEIKIRPVLPHIKEVLKEGFIVLNEVKAL